MLRQTRENNKFKENRQQITEDTRNKRKNKMRWWKERLKRYSTALTQRERRRTKVLSVRRKGRYRR